MDKSLICVTEKSITAQIFDSWTFIAFCCNKYLAVALYSVSFYCRVTQQRILILIN